MEEAVAQSSTCGTEPVCAVRKQRQTRGKGAAAPTVRTPPDATLARVSSFPRARRPAASPQPGVLVPLPVLPPGPEAGVGRQGEWAEAGAVASSKQPWDVRGAQDAWAGGTRAVFPRRRGSPDSSFGMHEYISLLMTIANKKTEKETLAVVPAQAPFGRATTGPVWVFGAAGKVREREGGREAPSLIPELTVTPTGDRPGPGADVQGQGNGNPTLQTWALVRVAGDARRTVDTRIGAGASKSGFVPGRTRPLSP